MIEIKPAFSINKHYHGLYREVVQWEDELQDKDYVFSLMTLCVDEEHEIVVKIYWPEEEPKNKKKVQKEIIEKFQECKGVKTKQVDF